MNTLQTEFRNENQLTKQLFRELFLFQFHLENISSLSDQADSETTEIIDMIDRLLDQLITYYDPEMD